MIPEESAIRPRSPDAADASARLAMAFLASVVLHALALGWPQGGPAGRLPVPARPAPLLARLAEPATAPALPAAPAADPEVPVSVGRKVGADDTPLTQKARFATPPDFSAAEAVPLVRAAHLKLRIHVTAQGRTARIEILESRLVPPDFLAAVSEMLAGARFLPGVAGGVAVDSSFDIVIDGNPPAEMGGAGVIVGPGR